MRFSTSQIGMLNAGRRVLRLVGAPIFTYAADRTKKHRIMVVCALFICYTSSLALLSVRTLLAVAFICVLRDGSFSFIPATSDAAANATLAKFPGASYGRMRLFGSLGWGGASFLNGFVVDTFFNGDLRAPLVVQAALGCLVITLAIWFVDFSAELFQAEEERRLAECEKEAALAAIAIAAGESRQGPNVQNVQWLLQVSMFVANVVMAGVALGTESTSLYIYMASLGVRNEILGLSTFISCGVEAACFLFLGNITQRIGGPERTFRVGIVLSATCLLILANVHRAVDPTVPFLLAQILIGVVFAFYWGSAVQIVGSLAPVGRETSAQGVLNAVGWGFGAPLGDLASGWILQSFGGPFLYSFIAIIELSVLALPLLLWSLISTVRLQRQGYQAVV